MKLRNFWNFGPYVAPGTRRDISKYLPTAIGRTGVLRGGFSETHPRYSYLFYGTIVMAEDVICSICTLIIYIPQLSNIYIYISNISNMSCVMWFLFLSTFFSNLSSLVFGTLMNVTEMQPIIWPGKRANITTENHHAIYSWLNQLFLLPFSSSQTVSHYQRAGWSVLLALKTNYPSNGESPIVSMKNENM